MTLVYGSGPQPNLVLLCGEAPGREEAERKISTGRDRPFIGRAGQEQDRYLSRFRIDPAPSTWYKTNVSKLYTPGNPDPTPDQIAQWTPHLIDEIQSCNPSLTLAIGKCAAEWFLGPCNLETVHGLPHRPGSFDPSLANRSPAHSIILPCFHPAAGFYEQDAKSFIAWDYSQIPDILHLIRNNLSINFRHDPLAGKERYRDVTGAELASYLDAHHHLVHLAIDTEGPFSIQVCIEPGTSYLLRSFRLDFHVGISAIQRFISRPSAYAIFHNAMYDLSICRGMGLNLRRINIIDTMYMAYLLRIEPQGLKPLSWRWAGMLMRDYKEVVGVIDIEEQISYLYRVCDLSKHWPKPDPEIIFENDGTSRIYNPQPIYKRALSIISDVESSKLNKDGEPTDPYKRWRDIPKSLRKPAEQQLGAIPVSSISTLFDRDPESATIYACRDADATLRCYSELLPVLERQGLIPLLEIGMKDLPVFEEMQSNGMPGSRSHFEKLYSDMRVDMVRLQRELSRDYYDGLPINPNSSQQIADLVNRLGLTAVKKTKTGKVSTAKKSIEHLRYNHRSMELVFSWREREHIRSAFCRPVLDQLDEIGEDIDYSDIHCPIMITRTATRRLASKKPNLLAIPSKTEIGLRVRHCYRLPEESSEVLGAWDYSQIEARCAAHLSGDPRMLSIFLEGRDIHSETAAMLFNLPLSMFKSPMSDEAKLKRKIAKTINFGVLYGLQPPGLMDQLRMNGITGYGLPECEKVTHDWFNVVFPKFGEYVDTVASQTFRHPLGLVRDHGGMIRYLPGIYSDDSKVRAEAGRMAVSHKVQGLAQGIIQKAIAYLEPVILDLQEIGLNIKWRLEVHDEIDLTFDRDLWDSLNEIIVDAMINHCGIRLRVPILVEGKMGKSWGELK